MTTNPGAYVPASDHFRNPNDNPALDTRPRNVGPLGLQDPVGRIEAGAFTEVRPLDIRSLAKGGAYVTSFFNDYYNRLYLLPSRLDFGAISGNATMTFYVWNAYLKVTTVTDVTIENGEGLTLDGPDLPTIYKPLAMEAYSLTASEEGPATVAAILRFETTTGVEEIEQTTPLPVVGVRAFLAPFMPNWAAPMRISYEYRTTVITSRAGREQRQALRAAPRKKVEYTANPRGASLRRANEIIHAAQARTVIMPEYPRKVRTVEPMVASPSVAVETMPYWLLPDMAAVMIEGSRQETRKVATVADDVVTFTSVSADPWGPGASIHPQLSGMFDTDLQSKRLTNMKTELSVDFDVTPASEPNPFPSSGVAPIMFNGREVLLKKPNWGQIPQLNYQHERDVVDYGRGRVARFFPIEHATRLWRATYLGRTWDEADLVREHFDRMKGRRGEFYYPTWEPDIIIKQPAAAATNGLRSDGLDLFQAFGGDTVMRAVAVFMRSGAYYLNRVTSVTDVSDDDGRDSLVSVATPWPITLTTENVLMICWLPVWRHATDILALEWQTDNVAQFQLTMQTLEDLEGV